MNVTPESEHGVWPPCSSHVLAAGHLTVQWHAGKLVDNRIHCGFVKERILYLSSCPHEAWSLLPLFNESLVLTSSFMERSAESWIVAILAHWDTDISIALLSLLPDEKWKTPLSSVQALANLCEARLGESHHQPFYGWRERVLNEETKRSCNICRFIQLTNCSQHWR
jgi:hypothetical protein